jgi:hypothetical protein
VLLTFKLILPLFLPQTLKCTDIFYSKDKIGEAEQGVVLVHIEDWPARADSPLVP